MFYKKADLKNLAIFTGKHLWRNLFCNENADLQFCNFIQRRLQPKCFPVNIAKFLRTPVLKNICERLFERFPTRINNITSNMKWGRHFLESKRKNTFLKLSLMNKNLPFHDHFFFLYFSNACQAAFALHNERW